MLDAAVLDWIFDPDRKPGDRLSPPLSHRYQGIRRIPFGPIDVRELWGERAAIREYCGGYGKEEAEALARRDVMELLGISEEEVNHYQLN